MEGIASIILNNGFITRLVMSKYSNGNIKVEGFMDSMKICELSENSDTLLPADIMALADTPYTEEFLEKLMSINILRCYVPLNNGNRKIYLCGLNNDKKVFDNGGQVLVTAAN